MLACSGGADSTFLAKAWLEWSALDACRWNASALVVDHGQRRTSAEDAQWAVERLSEMGLPAVSVRAECPSGSSEGEMRDARYRCFAAEAQRVGATVVLTAHHADDLAETVLLRIFRGTGLRGLAGIPSARLFGEAGDELEVRRPFLGLRRSAMRAELESSGLEWWEDPSNSDAQVAARNRLRLEVLPALAGISTGDPVEAVLRLAQEAGEWNECLDALLGQADNWADLPSFVRRQALAVEVRSVGETVSPARLADLEGALLRRQHAMINERVGLSLRGGCLTRLGERPARKDP
ncbi:MAG: tRNA lysidine(34) synthetase TilS [Planctomycetes bacterium]|nr:tRNA lysidine(34) synthetase TilS [Planctomycetota bacterium]